MEQEKTETTAAATETGKPKSNAELWLRGLFMLFFLVVTRLVEFVVLALLVVQFLYKLITKKPNQPLLDFGQSLSSYLYGIVRFQTFNTEVRPFPFSAWPSSAGQTTIETKPVEVSAEMERSGGAVPPTQAQAS